MNKVIVHLFTGKIAWKRSSYDTLSEVCGYTMYCFEMVSWACSQYLEVDVVGVVKPRGEGGAGLIMDKAQ